MSEGRIRDVRIISFSGAGDLLAGTVAAGLSAQRLRATVSIGHGPAKVDRTAWCADAFAHADALVFVGAAGIAVRTVAPFAAHKTSDPAVVCVDDAGTWCIPLIAGHIGGANRLAVQIARLVGGQACVTTATDVRGRWAVDEWAVRQGLSIADPQGIKAISSRILEGGEVTIAGEVEFIGDAPDGVRLVRPHRSRAPHADGRTGMCEVEGACPNGAPDIWVGASRRDATLHLVPRTTVLGVGCRRGTAAEAIARASDRLLRESGIDQRSIAQVASIDLKANEEGLAAFARDRGASFATYPAAVLNAQEGDFEPSGFVMGVTGCDNVCERAVSATGARIVVHKTIVDGIAFAIGSLPAAVSFAAQPDDRAGGRLSVVGIGPGDPAHMTGEALAALASAELVCGYTAYIDLVRPLIGDKPTLSTPMRAEADRCRAALAAAADGHDVALVCSGDAGVYGLAGLALQLAGEHPGVEVRVVSGVTAALSGAALLGAPLGHDFAVISLSDLLTPWDLIERRLRAAAASGLAIALYNPASRRRAGHLRRACDILLEYLPGTTACGVARNVGRSGESSWTCTLDELRTAELDMFCTAFVGNSATFAGGGRLVTPRGYRLDAPQDEGGAS